MRKIILLIIFISITTFSKSQNIDSILSFLQFNTRKPTLVEMSNWKNYWEINKRIQYKYKNDNAIEVINYNASFNDTISRVRYTYDLLNRVTSIVTENKSNGSNKLIFNQKQTITYNAINSLKYVIIKYEIFDEQTEKWQNSYQKTFIYDRFDNVVESLTQNYINNTWVRDDSLSNKSYYQYINPLSSKFKLQVDSIYRNGVMIASRKILKKYNNINIEIERAVFEYKNSWDTLFIESVEEDTNNIPIRMTIFDKWISQNRITDNGKIDSIIWGYFDKSKSYFEQTPMSYCRYFKLDSTWYLSSKYLTLIHDSIGSYTTTRYMREINEWRPSLKNSYYFDSKSSLIQKESYYFQQNSWVIRDGKKYTYKYTNDELIELIEMNYNTSAQSYSNFTKVEYLNYINTGINTNSNTLEAKLYPNPSSNGTVFVNVNLEAASTLNIKITDMKGSVVYTDERNVGKGLNTMELRNLQQGLYVVELTTEYGVARQKLAVK